MAVYGYTKNYKLIKPQFDSDSWHDYEYDNLDTIDAVLSAIYASGDWQGFWKTNTNYTTGSVVIDRDTDTMYKVLQDHTTDNTTFNEYYTAHPDYYRLWSPNNLAEDWAIKMDGDVETGEYSSKAHASSEGLVPTGSAKEWAIGSGTVGSSGEYSAKKYATDAHNDYISMTTNANVSAVASNINNVNAVGQSISNVNTVATNISDVNTTALNIEAIKDAPNQANAAENSKIEAQNSANTAQTMATQAGQSATSAAQSAQAAEDKADEASESARLAVSALSLQIGDVCFAPLGIDETLNLRRYLNGQVISQSQFVSFTNKVKSAIALHPNLATTEANWQAEKTNSKLGQCGKFVVDDTAGTIRLPAVVNAQGLTDLALIGGIKSESLPNISGNWAGVYNSVGLSGAVDGQFSLTDATLPGSAGVELQGVYAKFNINASRSSPAYQDNAPVQQEAVQYPYCIVVATGVEETLPAIREYEINNPHFFGQSMWTDVEPNNASWLASNGQWNAKSVYPDYYDWLVGQMNAGVSGFVASTATYTDYDFVINTADQTFRLPLLNGEESLTGNKRIDFAVKDSGGSYTAPANGWFCIDTWTTTSSTAYYNLINASNGIALLSVPNQGTSYQQRGNVPCKKNDTIVLAYAKLDLTRTTLKFVYAQGNGTLYFYVGDTVQDASLINAGAILGQLADVNGQLADVNGQLADVNGQLADVNASSRGYVVETYRNGTEWYRVYSDGWIEQGGRVYVNGSSTADINLLKPYSNQDYMVSISHSEAGTGGQSESYAQQTSATYFKLGNCCGNAQYFTWSACGY